MKKIFSVTLLLGMIGAASLAFAQTSASGTATGRGAAALANLITRAKDRADQEITRRINALNALNTRVNDMQKLTADEKAGLSATIQAQITAMQNLEAKIAADAGANSTSSLKADIQSIAKTYRIFALIIPQGAIEAAADRAMTVASTMQAFAGKLATKITSSTQATLNDMNAKIADATAQAQAAIAEVASLKPDNGVKTVMQSNLAAMKDARSKIQAAQQDLVAARKDAGAIVKALTGNANKNASTTP